MPTAAEKESAAGHKVVTAAVTALVTTHLTRISGLEAKVAALQAKVKDLEAKNAGLKLQAGKPLTKAATAKATKATKTAPADLNVSLGKPKAKRPKKAAEVPPPAPAVQESSPGMMPWQPQGTMQLVQQNPWSMHSVVKKEEQTEEIRVKSEMGGGGGYQPGFRF